MAAMTLIEYAKMAESDLDRGVIELFASGSPILGRLPFMNVTGGSYSYNVEERLPGIAFRGINQSYTGSTGIIVPVTEKVKIMGGECDTDVALVRRYGEARRAIDINMKIKAAARSFDRLFFSADEAADPLSFTGLNARLSGPQRLYADGGSGSAGLALTENMLQGLIDAVDDRPDMLIMGRAMRRQLTNLFKASLLFAFTEPDYFGIRTETFDGIPLGVLGRDETGTWLLDFTETEGSSVSICASIYALKFGEQQYICGIQTAAPAGKDFGEIPNSPVMRYRYDWDCGIAMFHPRCAARLSGVLKAANTI